MQQITSGCLIMACGFSVLLAGCSSPRPEVVQVQPQVRDVEPALRGLIGSEVDFRNTQPTVVSGLGIVVGLGGTGGQPLNDAVAATMERELSLMGIGRANEALKGTALGGKTPGEVLRDPNVAVVEVQSAVAPGAPNGTRFDVLVRALNATSLEGGTLWTTDLRIGPTTTFGQVRSKRLAVARGPVFVNPFRSEGAGNLDSGTVGRVLAGGEMVESLGIVVSLDTASHGRARSIVSAINSRFPQGRGDRSPTARGRTGSSIELTVPARYQSEPQEFLQLMQSVQIDQTVPELYARRYVDTMREQPELSERMSYALEALGVRALPQLRTMYDFPELRPRIAALRAGARLDDPRSAPALMDLASKGQGTIRLAAIRHLSLVDAGPQIEVTLRTLLSENDLAVRTAAYESLATRAEQARFAYLSELQDQNQDVTGTRYSPYQLQQLARESLPGGSLQGVGRRSIAGKFLLDEVVLDLPAGEVVSGRPPEPLIYVTQQGVPRIVLFGGDLSVRIGTYVSLWSNRLAIAGGDAGMLRVRYRRLGMPQAEEMQCKATLPDLIELLANEGDVRGGSVMGDVRKPGLNLTYSQVVAVLAALQQEGATVAAFSTEQDRLNAQIAAAQEGRALLQRADSPEGEAQVIVRPGAGQNQGTGEEPKGPRIVPIAPTAPGTPGSK